MTILATLRQSGGIDALARQLGGPPAVIMAAVEATLPGLIESFRQYSDGMPGLLQVIEAAGGVALAQSIMSHDKVDSQPGAKILASIQAGTAQSGANPAETGVDPDLRQRLMPLLAMLLGGYLSARSASGDLTVQQLAELLDGGKPLHSSGDEPV